MGEPRNFTACVPHSAGDSPGAHMTLSNATTNSSSRDTHEELSDQLSGWHTAAYTYLTPLLLTTGILTNLLNIAALRHRTSNSSAASSTHGARHKTQQQQRVTVFRYLFGLAVSQLLACVSLIPSILHIDRTNLSYSWAFYYAHFEILLINTPTASCVYILVGLSVDRYIAACRPGSYRKVSSPRLANARIACSLILPLLFYIPHCFLAKPSCNDKGTGWATVSSGTEDYIAWKIWAWIVELCHRLLPSLFIVFFNAKVIIKVRKVNRQFRDRNPSRQESISKTKNPGSKTCEVETSLIDNASVLNQDRDHEPEQRLAETKSQTSSKSAPSSPQKPAIKDTLRCSPKDSVKRTKARNNVRDQLEKQLANLLLAIIIVFLVTTLPAALLALSDNSDAKFKSFGYEIFRGIANLTELVGFSLNFFLYFTFMREFQDWLHGVCGGRSAAMQSCRAVEDDALSSATCTL